MSALITSTMPEVWGVLESGLIEEGKVTDVSLFSLLLSPLPSSNLG